MKKPAVRQTCLLDYSLTPVPPGELIHMTFAGEAKLIGDFINPFCAEPELDEPDPVFRDILLD